ncbi:succinylglutamate desuccinylase/aspartoacylase family protein [Halalkalicoccus salilacus]|uniref:succinylglutamate desuccinylase/aspartoacylase family protein n=1 Tax=Halalkalicoccus TaxID=332246 RepID=UPI002F968EAF
MVARPSRRGFLRTVGVAAGTSALGSAVLSGDPESSPDDREVRRERDETLDRDRHTLLTATNYETEVYTIEAPDPSTTVFVIGGMHGNERAGVEAAHLVAEYRIDRGRLVVIPEANKIAVERGNNHGPRGDLNRQFPMGSEPTTPIARAIWNEVLRVDPDYLLDMHTATGIYGIDGIGQAILPTDETIVHAANTVEYVNENYISDRRDLPHHELRLGMTIPEDRAALIHKASADRDMEGWLTEITRTGLDLHEQTFLHDVVTRTLLRQIDVEVTSEKALSNPF